jgi:hypothetical protein
MPAIFEIIARVSGSSRYRTRTSISVKPLSSKRSEGYTDTGSSYSGAKPLNWHWARLLEYWQLFHTWSLSTSALMCWIASGENRGKVRNSNGETPISSRLRSFIV